MSTIDDPVELPIEFMAEFAQQDEQRAAESHDVNVSPGGRLSAHIAMAVNGRQVPNIESYST